MQHRKYLVYCFLLAVQVAFAQTYKSGEKATAFINNEWKEVMITKIVPGKKNMFEVQVIASKDQRGMAKSSFQVNQKNLRTINQFVANPLISAKKETSLHLGKYELYSGIPSMYLGHLILLNDGKYKVAFSTDETNYETGNYTFHEDTGTIEWLTGMFRNQGWGGKVLNNTNKVFRIEFNKATYAETQ